MNRETELKLKATAASLPKMCRRVLRTRTHIESTKDNPDQFGRYTKREVKTPYYDLKDIDHLREIKRRYLHGGMEAVARYQNEMMKLYKEQRLSSSRYNPDQSGSLEVTTEGQKSRPIGAVKSRPSTIAQGDSSTTAQGDSSTIAQGDSLNNELKEAV